MRSTHGTLVSLALALLAALPARSQSDVPDSLVYIRDDHESMNRLLDEARTAVSEGRWQDAIDGYLEVIERHEDEMAAWGPQTAISTAERARLDLADLPPAGREVLEKRFEPARREELEPATRALDVDALATIADSVPVPSAAAAASRLADLFLERGEPSAALTWLHRLSLRHPDGTKEVPAPSIKARIAAARRMLGGDPLTDPLAPLPGTNGGGTIGGPGGNPGDRTRPAAAEVRIAGEELPLAQYLERLRETPARHAPSWQTFSGRAGSPGLPDADRLEHAWSFDRLRDTRSEVRTPEQEKNPVRRVFPVEREGLVLAYDGVHALALDKESGKIRWMKDLQDELELGLVSGPARPYLYGAADDERYAIVHEYYHAGEGFVSLYPPFRRVVVLSTRDGDLQWTRGGPLDPDELLRDMRFSGAPLLWGERLFVAARRASESEGETKCYAVAFDARDGRLLFTRFLCSAPALGSEERNVFTDGPFLAMGEGYLYCGTEGGILSALDPRTGEHRWCHRYERIPYRTRDNSRLIFSYVESWSDNPMIVDGARLYATPGDSPYLHVLLFQPERESGLVRLARIEKARYRYLVGVRDRTVYLAGRDESRRYHVVSALHPEGGPRCRLWDFPIPNPEPGGEAPQDRPLGRALLSGNRIWVPTYKGVYVLDVSGGEFVGQIPNPPGSPRFGNLLHAGTDLIAALDTEIHCYRPTDR